MDIWLSNLMSKFADKTVDEILINGIRSMACVRAQTTEVFDSPFTDIASSTRWVQDFVFSQGGRLDPIVPAAGGVIDGGAYRWHAVMDPISVDGPLFSLRRHRFSEVEVGDFEFTVPGDHERLIRLFGDRLPILICGVTGSGKSTIMTALLRQYAETERVIILETSPEIPSLHPTWVRLLAKGKSISGSGEIPISTLLAESLRLRPDRIVVGEIRDLEAAVFFDCIATGHSGAISTIHASTVSEVQARVVGSLLKSGFGDSYAQNLLASLTGLVCVFMKRGVRPIVERIEPANFLHKVYT